MPRLSPAVPTPFAIALPAPPNGYGALINEFYEFHKQRGIKAVRPPNIRRGRDYYTVWQFETEAMAEEFRARFGGERLVEGTT